MPTCSVCGEENPAHARFCLNCGSPMPRHPPARTEARKTVTVLFADVTGSTSLGERLDPEAMRALMNRYFQEMRTILERHGGTVEKFIGDAVVAVFGIPVLHEDDAARAVRAAVAMREALGRLNEDFKRERGVEIHVRIGVNTGEVVAGDAPDGGTFATGDAVNVAARLEAAASPGDVLIGDLTRRLAGDVIRAEPLEPLALKGKAAPYTAWRLTAVLPDVPAYTREVAAPFVGRDGELKTLLGALDRAAADRLCILCTIVGPAGIGKSRLAREFIAAAAERARVVIGRCLPYGQKITFSPLADIVAQVAGDPPERALSELLGGTEWSALAVNRILGVLGLATPQGQAEGAPWAFRKLFEALGQHAPVVAVIDDIHWAEPTLLDLLEYLVSFVTDTPLLILCLARPDLFEDTPSWATPTTLSSVISLSQLPEKDAAALVDELAGPDGLPDDVRAGILGAAEGNPLFVEQLLALQVAGSESPRAVPATIEAVLAARIDRLPPDERDVVERASIEGREFHRGAVAALSPATPGARLDVLLTSLVRKELIRLDSPELSGHDDVFRFVHVLVRDAAYESVSKQRRAELHERFADWCEGAAGGRVTQEQVIGYHLEQAYRYRAELGPVDEGARNLARAAADRLATAGRRAVARRDVRGAERLLTRACDLFAADDPGRLAALADLADALVDAGDLNRADALLERLIVEAHASGNESLATHSRLRHAEAGVHTGHADERDILREAEAAIGFFGAGDDHRGLAHAWALVGRARFWLGAAQASEEAYEQAAKFARLSGDLLRETQTLAWWIGSVAHGPAPAPAGIAFCDDVLRRGLNDPLVDIFALEKRGLLEAMQGRFADARASVGRAQRIADELDLQVRSGMCREYAGRIELLAGDPTAAERELRAGYDLLGSLGESAFRASVGGCLAEALYQLDRVRESAAMLDTDDPETDALRGKILARMGDLERGERLARSAVERLKAFDYLDARAKASMDLGVVLGLTRSFAEAADSITDAMYLYEQKGNTVAAAAARDALRALTP